MISGIKRKTTAIEGTFRFFQTVDLIINHFKREADREKIFELIDKEATFRDLLIATAAVHLYHNLGIRVEESLEISQDTVASTRNLEFMEKKALMEEVTLLLKNSFDLEINMLYRIIDLEDRFISLLIKERKAKIQDIEKEKIVNDIEDQIERELLEIILKNHPFYFYDLIGELIGLNNKLKADILVEGSGFKDLSIELEKKLQKEEKEDKFIEISTLNRLINVIQEKFEFKSYKELQTQTMPVRMIKRKILEYDFERYPISIDGLYAYQNANYFKKDLIRKIEGALNAKINYEQFERDMFKYLKSEIMKQLKKNPNDFIYFLQNLNESSFSEIIYMMNKYGVYNFLNLINVDEELAEKVKKNMIRYNIDKYNIMMINDESKNLIYLAKKAMCELDFSYFNKLASNNRDLSKFKFINIVDQEDDYLTDFWERLEENTGYSKKVFREFVRRKQIIDKVFLQDLKLNNYSQILLLLNFENLIENLVKDIFYYILSKILRQLSRIIEAYSKVTNEKALFLMAMKKMYATTDSEKWVWVKIEELLIERIKKRQEELVVVFDAINQPFLVNGFIFARLTDTSLKNGIHELKNNASPIYEGIRPLQLKSDLISPVSYCIAYDLIKRFEFYNKIRKSKVEKKIELKQRKQEAKKRTIREKQEKSTLNWIERRITSSLMRINSPGINPNQLYWQDKDTKTTTDNIKLHSELKGNFIDLVSQFFRFAVEKIKSFEPAINLPSFEKIKHLTSETTNKILMKRLGHPPSSKDIEKLIEGERYEISKQIAIRIGKILDKSLYTKFKSKRR